MTEPQVWTLIGVFAATMAGMVTLVLSTIRAEMGKLRFELRGDMTELRGELRGEMTELRGELRGEMSELRADLRADIAEVRGDVDALYRHAFGTPPSHGPRES